VEVSRERTKESRSFLFLVSCVFMMKKRGNSSHDFKPLQVNQDLNRQGNNDSKHKARERICL
jgi:hypothetical protein